MSYKDIHFEDSYETSGIKTQLLEEFYIPMLRETTMYFRIAGFFSSTSLAIASKGIEGLIANNGIMRLLISPKLSEQDFRVIQNNNSIDEMTMFKEFDVSNFSNFDNLQALSWMLANKKIEIKIVIDKNYGDSLFHQKVGIGYDKDGNMLSFSGSINETAQAWLSNIEEFKTFKSWVPGQETYLFGDLKKFNSYWNNERQDIAKVYDLPESLKKKIIDIAPRNIKDLSIMKKYKDKNIIEKNSISLFDHQEKAVKEWENNNYKLLMEMATGTGKTRTAIGCFLTQLNKINKYFVIVATPQNTLSKQWKQDIEENLKISFEKSEIIDGNVVKWDKKLETILLDLNVGLINNAIIYSTHSTISDKKFLNVIKNTKGSAKILFICDEVHGIGSEHQKEALIDEYDYRIGLSATPERLFDEEGTNLIREYFGNKSFEFTIAEALGTINPLTGKPFLNPFYYIPIFVDLTEKERADYIKYTKKIQYLESLDDVEEKDINLQRILRADILKNATSKLDSLEKLLERIQNKEKIRNTIIFATENQLADVLNLLSKQGITRAKITENESTTKKMGIKGLSEREEYIDQFRKGNIQTLIGLKCLDEGIDIKNARVAILMASSTNPREYVQRIGRVIRPDTDKKYSEIYDFIVMPTGDYKIDERILEKEAIRAFQIAKNAINYNDIKNLFYIKGVIE